MPSVAFDVALGIPAATSLGHPFDNRKGTSAPGFAWAARRELLNRHLFFDTCILGGGSRAMACAAYHCLEELINRHRMNEQERQRYVAWAEPYYATVRAETSFLDVDIFHLWHGDSVNRQKARAREEFQRFQFDPGTDITVHENGCWRWNSDKQEMHEYLRAYFAARREDG